MKPHVFFYVQYLEGIGHVVRAQRIVEALCQQGCRVTLVLGGNPITEFTAANADVHQLPPLSAGPRSYSTLLTPDGQPADEAYKAARCDQLLSLYNTAMPDVVITEAYPMGRWAMHFELEPLLERVHRTRARPMVVASLRDILQMPKRDEKSQKSIDLFARYYDHMLVHGDPNMVRIEESFPPLRPHLERAHYTGIVAPGASFSEVPKAEVFDVIVSGGGGAIGYEVLAAAIAAKPMSTMRTSRWLALSGPRMAEEKFNLLLALAEQHDVQLERYRANLVGLLTGAELSIQRAGYNTVADMLIANCRSVLVPDAADQQMEQPIRAEKLAALDRVTVVHETELTPETMAEAIDRAMAGTATNVNLDMDGSVRSAEMLLALFASYKSA